MQYGMEVYPYKRINKTDSGKKLNKNAGKRYVFSICTYFIAAFLISRIILVNSIAPFGVATLISFISTKDKKAMLIVGGGILLGYITISNCINGIGLYFIIVVSLLSLGYFVNFKSRTKNLILPFLLILVESFIYKFFIMNFSISVALFVSLIEVVCIVPIYLILNFSKICFQDFGTKHLFSNEELISMAIGISLMVSGTWGISFWGISLRNILALSFILSISYINGCGIGAASGVAMGSIIGMSSKNINSYISIFGLCGFIPGIFKETGKWLSVVSYLVSSAILIIYSNIGSQYKYIEVLISGAIFIAIPDRLYDKLAIELNKDNKEEKLKEGYINKVKGIFSERLKEFSTVFFNISDTLHNLVDNDKLALKSKSSFLIENLADRVCSSCNMNSMCWKRELHFTYSAFSELICNFQMNKAEIPVELEKKCIKRTELIKQTEEIVTNYTIGEILKNRLSEGRELIASQIENVAFSIEDIMKEINSEIKFNCEMENRIINVLEKKRIFIYDCACIDDKNDRLVIKMSMNVCGGIQTCVREILPYINEAAMRSMCVSDEGCHIDAKTQRCRVTFEELPKFYVSTYVSRQCKDGEKFNGDNYYFTKLKDGTYMSIISDGMGSGPEAGKESKAVIDLIEKLTVSGFSKITAINTANSIMALKFPENEKFSTIDLCSIDLYTGEVEFMKVGAVSSFIKRENKVYLINSKTLPIGVLDKVDIEVNKKKVNSGDVIVMLSDGVLDYNSNKTGDTEWIVQYLVECKNSSPKVIADGLLQRSRELSGKVKDDMTVLVSKVVSTY